MKRSLLAVASLMTIVTNALSQTYESMSQSRWLVNSPPVNYVNKKNSIPSLEACSSDATKEGCYFPLTSDQADRILALYVKSMA